MGQTTPFRSVDYNTWIDRSAITSLIGFVPGNIFYVDSSTGLSTNSGESRKSALATLDQAMDKCFANKGDVICLLPGHVETTNNTQLDVAGVTILGFGNGRNRPTFTAAAEAEDAIDVAAANIRLQNVRILGAASGCTALINIGSTDFHCFNCSLEQAATPLMAVTVEDECDRFIFRGCTFTGSADGPDVAIDFEGNCDNWVVEDCYFNYATYGLDLAVLRADNHVVPGGIFRDCVCTGIVALILDFDSSAAKTGDGIVDNVVCATLTTTVANVDTLVDAGGYVMSRLYVTQLPSESAAKIPVTTAD